MQNDNLFLNACIFFDVSLFNVTFPTATKFESVHKNSIFSAYLIQIWHFK